MIFTVTWLPGAEDELAMLWLDTVTRVDVSDAANQIDKMLRLDPDQLGESRDDDQRIVFVAPLGVLFHVNSPDRQVKVIHVWKFA